MIDAHVHLQADEFAADRDEVILRAVNAGVERFLCNGTVPPDWALVAELARRHRQIVPCYGVHPWYVNECGADWQEQLQGYLQPGPAAIGEIGLDRWLKTRDEARQEELFNIQLDLACRLERPAMIHCLKAWGWLMEQFRRRPPGRMPRAFLLHACGAAPEMIKPLMQWGGYFSFAGTIFLPHKHQTREAVKAVPLDRLLLETDAPDMPLPVEMRLRERAGPDGKAINEPVNLAAVYRQVADLLQMPLAELIEITRQNVRRLLGENCDDSKTESQIV